MFLTIIVCHEQLIVKKKEDDHEEICFFLSFIMS